MIEIIEQQICTAPAFEVYAWILDVESYKTWVPHCVDSGVLKSHSETEKEAYLSMRIGPWTEKIVTKNRAIPCSKVTMSIVKGPFKTFYGQWDLEERPDQTTLVTLTIRAELSPWFLEPIVELAIVQDRHKILHLLQDRFLIQRGN